MKKEGFSTIASLCFAIIFVGALLTLAVMGIFDFDETRSFFENRRLDALPRYSEESVKDGSYFTGIEDFLQDHSAFRDELLEAKTYADLYVLRRPVVNDIVPNHEALLPFLDYEVVDEETVKNDAAVAVDTVKSHAELVESYGGSYYYVAMPNQYLCYGDSYPWYLNNRGEYLSLSSAEFFAGLDEAGIDYIDMYDYYLSEGDEDMTSTIDHHYSLMGAYETLRTIIERVERDTDFAFDKERLYHPGFMELPNRYVGSRSRKLFGLWESDERLYIMPEGSVRYDRWNNGVKVPSKVYKLPETDTEDVTYTTYMGGDIANTVIKTYREELPSVLIYGESFTNALESIAWCYFDEMHSIDLRHYREMTLDEYIELTKPDVVLCVREYSSMLLPEDMGQ